MIKKVLLFLLIVFNLNCLFSQISKVHYIPPISSGDSGGGVSDQYIYLSTPSDSPVDYEILAVGGGIVKEGTLTNKQNVDFYIGDGESQLKINKSLSNTVINNKGYIITASCPIYVSVRYNAGYDDRFDLYYHAGAFTSKGTAGLGTHFRTAMMPMGDLQTPALTSGFHSYVSIMATEDNTIIKATLPNATQGMNIINHGGYNGTPIESNLNKGESFVLAIDADSQNNQNNRFALFGALIQSVDNNGNEDKSKPIAVTVGSATGTFAENVAGRDHGLDQIAPIEKVGHEYIFIRTKGNNSIENVILVADKNNTEIYVNDSKTPTKTLNAGDFIILEGDNYSSQNLGANMYVRTQGDSHPVFAYQGVGEIFTGSNGNSPNANQGMFFVPPLSEEAQDDINNIAQINKIGNLDFTGSISIVYKENASLEVNIGNNVNGQYVYNPVDLTGIIPKTVLGTTGYLTMTLTGLDGDIQVKSDNELYVAYYNVNSAATSGGFYAGFATPPTATIDLNLQSLGTCVEIDPNTGDYLFNGNGFEITNPDFFDTWQWQEESGTNNWSLATGSQIDDLIYIPSKPGSYRLIGSISCLGQDGDFNSGVIKVNICPNDSDNDGIINNVDLDLDNDGILNSNESNGDVLFDLTDLNSPILSNKESALAVTLTTILESKINGIIDTSDNSITGFNDGSFETNIPSRSSDASISYSIKDLSEELNFRLTSQPVNHSIVGGEYFEIEVFPVTKNITLLDPNNQLLVQKNATSPVFEELNEVNGLKIFTNGSIKFKFNPDVTTPPDFEFIAYGIEGIKFTHHTEGNTSNGVFKGKISGLDYFLNTDANHPNNSDLVPDYYDIDSDGDECNDVTEAGFDDGILIDGILGDVVPTFDDSLVDNRGRVINHDYEVLPLKDSVTELYYFQQVGQAVEIINEPSSASACIGDTITFNVTAQHPSDVISYKWQIYNDSEDSWTDLTETDYYSGIDSPILTVSNILAEMNGEEYRVQLKTQEYQCIVNSNLGANIGLTVNIPPSAPIVDPIQTFCLTDNPTVGDLQIGPNNPTGLIVTVYDNYDPNDSTIGTLLDATDPLSDGTTYYMQVSDTEGCVSASRSQTKVILPNPLITSSVTESCPGEEITITANGIPQTALDFELANPTLTKILSDHVNDKGRISTYFVDPIARTFSQAENLLPTYGTGASMYQINDLKEHDSVWNSIVKNNLDGQIPLWLGLKQIPSLNPNQKFDEGWYWLDGRELDSSWNLWQSGEPNDYDLDKSDSDGIDDGTEDYGHFNLAGAGKFLNDYPEEVESRPLYEFSGTTTVKWYYEDPSNPGTFIDIPINTSTLTLKPEFTTTYFIDVTTNGVVCSTSYTHVVNPMPKINLIPDHIFCDNDNDGDANNGSIILQEEDFNVLKTSILGEDQDVNDFSFSFYISEENALTGSDAINFPYTTPSKESTALHWENISTEIFVRVTNNTTGCVISGKAFNLIVNTLPIVFEVDDLLFCDDDYDGIVAGFDLESRTNELRSGNENSDPNDIDNQSSDNFPITYHVSLDDANNLNNLGVTSPYESGNATIYYRIQKMTNDGQLVCFKTGEAFNLIVTPLPVIKTEFVNIEQCDDGKGSENDGVTLHNLTESQSLFSDNYENEVFEYYKDLDLTQKIENPTAYENEAFNDKVYLKITTQDGCEMTSKSPSGSDRLVINIRVGASEISETFIEDNNTLYSVCEDSDALSQDGLSLFSSSVLQEINTKLINSNPKFADQNIKVTLHRNSTDGLTGENPINLNEDFTSSTPYTQEIWARIVNIDITEFTCLGYAKVGELYVEPKPIANPVTIEKQCDGDSPLDLDSQDGIFPFNVSLIEQQVINGQAGTSVTYFNEDGTQIENFGPFFETASQTITIRVERDPSYPNVSNPDGVCYDETTLEFVVNDSPEAYPVVLDAHCDGDDGASDTDGYDIFDTSNVISTLTTNPDTGISQDLSKLNITFTYIDELGIVKTDDKLPNPFNTKTQTVSVTIENPLNLNCIITQEIDFVVNPLPSFDIDDETIVCLNPLPDNPIEVGTFNWNGANDPTIYNYSWSRVDLNGLDDTSFNETTETIKVDKGGVYTVIVEDAITFCTRSKSITVTESEMATISLEDITVEDLKNDDTNTVTINTLNLGIGDYEFSLDEPFGPYQDEPVFESVKPGIHTIYIRDKNSYYTYDYGCGIAQIDISVIGYRKYFTPNGDGINETWKILGIRSDFNANSNVYIFDRFGKLIKELDPLTDGWDGTYLGKPMPATDYWFRTYLEDGREFKGHFSLIRGN